MAKLVNLADLAYVLYYFVPLRFLVFISRLHGRLQYSTRKHERSAVAGNLSQILPEKSRNEIEALTREFFEYQQIRNLLWTLAPHWTLEEMERMFPIDGLDRLDRALAQKKGVILLGCHLNSICMFVAIIMLRKKGYDIGVPLTEAGDPWAPTAFRKLIEGKDTKPVIERIGAFYCQFNIRPIIQKLSQNVIVSQTGDGWHAAAFVEVPFFGRELPFPTGVMSIARTTGAIVVPLFEVGTPPDKLRFVFEEGFPVDRGVDPKEDIRVRMVGYAAQLERHIRANINRWQHWSHPNTLDTMASWTGKTLKERYKVH
jgi:lauroyl/myristoyl acyltransferase